MDIEAVYEQYNIGDLERATENLFPDWDINLKELFDRVLSGEGVGLFGALGEQLLQNIAGELTGLKSIFITLILIGIASAIFVCANLMKTKVLRFRRCNDFYNSAIAKLT